MVYRNAAGASGIKRPGLPERGAGAHTYETDRCAGGSGHCRCISLHAGFLIHHRAMPGRGRRVFGVWVLIGDCVIEIYHCIRLNFTDSSLRSA